MMSDNSTPKLPIVALRGIVSMPYVIMSFDTSKSYNAAAVNAALESDNRIIMLCTRDPKVRDIAPSDLYEYGCICRITKIFKLSDENNRVFVEGITRVHIDSFVQGEPCLTASYTELSDYPGPYGEALTLRQMISRKFKDFTFSNGKVPIKNVIESVEQIPDDIRYVYSVANIVLQHYEDRQTFIEQEDQSTRCLNLLSAMNREEEFAKLMRKIDDDVHRQLERNQREYFLREQIKAIRKELGETEQNEADEFRERLKNKVVPDEIRERIAREIDRFSTLPAGSHEMPSMRTFIECMLDLPFTETSEDNLDVENARSILDRDHYGLEKVKERVLEHLAVAQLTGKVL